MLTSHCSALQKLRRLALRASVRQEECPPGEWSAPGLFVVVAIQDLAAGVKKVVVAFGKLFP